jgi:hypothetical protein
MDLECDPNAGNGGGGGVAAFSGSLPRLDPSGRPQRVIPISLSGGPGGTGGNGGSTQSDMGPNGSPGGNGGAGGDAVLEATLDAPDPIPAQYLIAMAAGAGGSGGQGTTFFGSQPAPGAPGGPGQIRATIDGQPVLGV